MKKRIGILTFHNAINYGAALQCYALSKKLTSMGFDVQVIDYRNSSIDKEYSLLKLNKYNGLKSYFIEKSKKIIFFNRNFSKKKLFEKFIKDNCKLSKKYTYEMLNKSNDFDILITGSDQVWNKEITGGLDKAYLLDVDKNIQRYSYAASIGKDIIKKAEAEEIYDIIKSYDAVSVREKTLENALKEAGIKDISTVLDPVFLISKNEWEKMLDNRLVNEKYILVYMMEYNDNVRRIVDEISNKTGLKVITFNKISRYNNILENKFVSGPKEFLNYIKNAELVITNSFHATAFSIILQKNFFTIKHTEKNSRINEILTKFNLQKRLLVDVKDVEQIDLNSNIDYNKTQELVDSELNESLKFLDGIGKKDNE